MSARARRFIIFPGTEGSGVGVDFASSTRPDLTYSHDLAPADPRNPIYSFLRRATQTGYRRNGAGYDRRSRPFTSFDYTEPVLGKIVETVDRDSVENLPMGLDGSVYRWVDLHGEGIPGILTEQAEAWFYKRNLSPLPERSSEGPPRVKATFAPLGVVAQKPNASLSSGAEFMDLEGDEFARSGHARRA